VNEDVLIDRNQFGRLLWQDDLGLRDVVSGRFGSNSMRRLAETAIFSAAGRLYIDEF